MEFLPKIEISKEKITQRFGYSSSLPEKLEKAIEEMLNRAKDLFSPRGVYVSRRIIHFPEKGAKINYAKRLLSLLLSLG